MDIMDSVMLKYILIISEDDSASVSSNTNEAPDSTQSKKSTEPPKTSQPGSKTDPKSAMRSSASTKSI